MRSATSRLSGGGFPSRRPAPPRLQCAYLGRGWSRALPAPTRAQARARARRTSRAPARPSGSARSRASAARRPTACRRPAASVRAVAETSRAPARDSCARSARARGIIAPMSRFSDTERFGKICRPSATCPMPRLQTLIARPAGDVGAAKAMRPRAGLTHAGDGADQRGLAGTIGADNRDDRAFRHLERHAVERLRIAVEHVDARRSPASVHRLGAEIAGEHRRDRGSRLVGRALARSPCRNSAPRFAATAPSPRASRARSEGWSARSRR